MMTFEGSNNMMHLMKKQGEIAFCRDCIMKGYDNIDADADVMIANLKREHNFES